MEEAEAQAREIGEVIIGLKDRVAELLKKDHMTEVEARELESMNRELMEHMAAFEEKTKLIQMLMQIADEHIKGIGQIPEDKVITKNLNRYSQMR